MPLILRSVLAPPPAVLLGSRPPPCAADPEKLLSAVVEIGVTKLRRDFVAHFIGEGVHGPHTMPSPRPINIAVAARHAAKRAPIMRQAARRTSPSVLHIELPATAAPAIPRNFYHSSGVLTLSHDLVLPTFPNYPLSPKFL